MERRNFLAFIPSLAAIPFIGRDIVKNESGIHILEPKPIEIVKTLDSPMDLEVRLYANGKHVGDAYITSFYINGSMYSGAEMTMECLIKDPNTLVKNIYP